MTIEDINRKKCSDKAEELWQQIENGELILPKDEKYPMGKDIWINEYGTIPTKTKIRKAEIRVRWASDYETLPWVEWIYYVKGNRQSYWADEMYDTRRDAELAIAREDLETFIRTFSSRVKEFGFTKEDFPELETLKELKQLQ